MDNDTKQNGNTDISSQPSSGSNARKISSTFQKNLKVEPRAVTGNIDGRDKNVLNLQKNQPRSQTMPQEEVSPDVFDQKIIDSTEESKKRIDEEKLREHGPDDTEEAIAATEQIYEDEDMAVNQGVVQSLRNESDYMPERPEIPQFPVIMFTFAIMKDIIDFFLTAGIATVVFAIIAQIFSALFGVALFIWMLSKSQTKNRKLFKKQVKGAIGTVIIEQIPVLQALPMEALFIYWTYRKEMKAYKAEIRAAQKLKELNIVRK